MDFLKKNKSKLIWGVAVLVALFIGINRVQAQKLKNPATFNQSKDIVVTPETKSISSNLVLAGSINAAEVANLRFQNSGKLVWVGVKVGDRVKKWQTIASLDKAELKKSLQTQFNNYRTQLSQFWDIQDKYKDMVISDTIQRILDRTQYSLDNSVINYEITDMAIKEASLVSPINGVVVAMDQNLPGTNITPATATFTIVNPSSVYFRSEIDQEEVVKIKVGQKATLKIDAFPDSNFDSEITYIAYTPMSGQSSTVYEIRFRLPVENQDLSYRLGMDGDATITLDQKDNALVLPLEAVINEDSKTFVWLKNNGQLEKRYVTTGIENDTEIEILSDLNPNDQVVIKKN
ncbi:efflux RND transporter periplasmic adaptor subunit [Candidatus Shapirobacteria bacterium]|nr:efflux RND transporter periplasmic adaptor subunit [Candidatus Shapirobacteria bacterium]